MATETSAGGVVVRSNGNTLEIAVIRPRGRKAWALPKGHVDQGEVPEETARREVREETGVDAKLDQPLGETRYFYSREGRRIQKRVHFFLFRYQSGEIDALAPEMRIEVDQAQWMLLPVAVKELTYPGERQIASKALALLCG